METLADRIARDGPLNELDAVGWIIRLAKKLETIHGRGHAHGSVSPSSIKTANVSRTTLGILTPGQTTKSRLEFQSPERVTLGVTSPADDTWAAAATLYQLLTGTSPFGATDEDTTRQKIAAANPAPLATFDVADDDLQHILDAALARDAGQRSSTISGLRAALEGWHPDPTARDLPALGDDEPMEDDDEERTQMRPMAGAVSAMRAAAARRDPAKAPPMRAPAQTVPNMPAVTTALVAASVPGAPLPKAHDLLEDDDENAKTSLIRVPMMPMRKPGAAPAAPTAPAAPAAPAVPAAARPNIGQAPTSQRIGPAPVSARLPAVPPAPTSTSGPASGPLAPMARPAGGPAARALQAARSGAPSARTPLAPPVAAPAPAASRPSSSGISRDAVIDDGDDEEATVMREAPIELLMQSSNADTSTDHDRATPVNPIPAEVAAAASRPGHDMATPPAPKHEDVTPPATNHLAATPREAPIVPDALMNAPPNARQPEPTMVLPQDDEAATLYISAKDAAAIQIPPAPAPAPARVADSLPDLFSNTSEHRAEPAINPNMASAMPSRLGTQPPGGQPMPLAPAPEPSATKGLILGILIALVLLGAAAAVFFLVIKK